MMKSKTQFRHPLVAVVLGIFACDGGGGDSTSSDSSGAMQSDSSAPAEPSSSSDGGAMTGTTVGGEQEEGAAETHNPGGSSDSDGGEAETGASCVMGQTDPNQVVMLGDSYLAITGVPAQIFLRARQAGALAPDETYRRYDVAGTQMSNGQIPSQFATALAADPDITTVIMTGGGNDVLIGSASGCLQNPPPDDPACVAALQLVFDAAEVLISDMADAGVVDLVYFFYPHLPAGGFVSGAKDETLDYAYPFVEALCESAPLHCVFVDTREAFEGHQDEYFIFDGIHPNALGSEVLAEVVWAAMVDECVAQ